MVDFQIEPGLPPYGPAALSFPAPDAFSEGLVVRFATSTRPQWVANFAPGFGQLNDVRVELGPQAVIVVAQGAGYCIDVDRQQLVANLAGPIEYIGYFEMQAVMVVGNGLWFEALDRAGTRWRTRRISWDGMRLLEAKGGAIIGEAYSPVGPPEWLPFELDLSTGEVVGGSYNGPSL